MQPAFEASPAALRAFDRHANLQQTCTLAVRHARGMHKSGGWRFEERIGVTGKSIWLQRSMNP
ncbi:hypothetical protein PUN4_50119 [Paraburkholderia unamae]|nr:hypothetical protein PUN4_50119 [Paraburkholderia unamae]